MYQYYDEDFWYLTYRGVYMNVCEIMEYFTEKYVGIKELEG